MRDAAVMPGCLLVWAVGVGVVVVAPASDVLSISICRMSSPVCRCPISRDVRILDELFSIQRVVNTNIIATRDNAYRRARHAPRRCVCKHRNDCKHLILKLFNAPANALRAREFCSKTRISSAHMQKLREYTKTHNGDGRRR